MENITKKFLIMLKNSATDTFKTTSKKAIQETVEETGDFIVYEIADKAIKVSKGSPQNNLEIVESETEHKKMPKERYISPAKIQQIIDDIRLI